MRDYIFFAIRLLISLSCVLTAGGAPLVVRDGRLLSPTYITLEEHYDSQSVRKYQIDPIYTLLIDALGNSTTPFLHNINGSRLNSMNENGIRLQASSPHDPASA